MAGAADSPYSEAVLRRYAKKAARKRGLKPKLFVRQIDVESGFDPDIVSPAGATGVAQIMPATAQGWGVDPLDPIASIDAAAKHMAEYVQKYGGYENALRAYNAGPGAIEASRNYDETNAYVAKILQGANPGGLDKPVRNTNAGAAGAPFRLPVAPAFDQAGYQQAKDAALVGALLARRRGTDSPLFRLGVLTTSQPDPADFAQTPGVAQLLAGMRPEGPAGSSVGSTLVIGDSLGVGTAPYLKKLLGDMDADVEEGRSSANGIQALRDRIGQGNYQNIVLDLGTNDTTARSLRTSVREALALAPGAQIYLPTLNGPYATSRKNQILRQIAAANPNVHLIPWASRAQGLLAGDGIHATGEGYRARARLIARQLGWTPQQQAGPSAGGSASPSGRVRGTLQEMFYRGPGGINVDAGRRVGRDFVDGHETHVHVGGDGRSMVELGKMAQGMGLTVRENPAFDPVDPVHTDGSYHYRRDRKGRGRGIDVSGPAAKLREFNHMVARMYGVR